MSIPKIRAGRIAGVDELLKKDFEIRKIVQKIPIFKGFEHHQILAILKICASVPIASGETVYAKGEPSGDMLILLKGELSVVGDSGEQLALILPGGSVGEMGMFTGHPRSARIASYEPSVGIVIKRSDLIEVLRRDKDMHIKLLYNLVALLSNRLVDTGLLVESLQSAVSDAGEDDNEFDDDESGHDGSESDGQGTDREEPADDDD